MPKNSEVDVEEVKKKVTDLISNYDDKIEIKNGDIFEIGFGLKAFEIEFKIDENLGSEDLENKISDLEIVGDCNVLKMDRL